MKPDPAILAEVRSSNSSRWLVTILWLASLSANTQTGAK